MKRETEILSSQSAWYIQALQVGKHAANIGTMNSKFIKEILAIALGGALGSVLRFLLSGWVQGRTQTSFFPWGILTVNLIGCFIIGILFGLTMERLVTDPILRSGLFIGLLGGFTTFSSFTLDTITLFHSGALGTATIYILASVLVGILATTLGLSLTKFF